MMKLYIIDSDKPLQINDYIDFYLDIYGVKIQTYKVVKIHNKRIHDALCKIELIWSSDISDLPIMSNVYDLEEQHLKHFKYNTIDSRTSLGKLINKIYTKEKENV